MYEAIIGVISGVICIAIGYLLGVFVISRRQTAAINAQLRADYLAISNEIRQKSQNLRLGTKKTPEKFSDSKIRYGMGASTNKREDRRFKE